MFTLVDVFTFLPESVDLFKLAFLPESVDLLTSVDGFTDGFGGFKFVVLFGWMVLFWFGCCIVEVPVGTVIVLISVVFSYVGLV